MNLKVLRDPKCFERCTGPQGAKRIFYFSGTSISTCLDTLKVNLVSFGCDFRMLIIKSDTYYDDLISILQHSAPMIFSCHFHTRCSLQSELAELKMLLGGCKSYMFIFANVHTFCVWWIQIGQIKSTWFRCSGYFCDTIKTTTKLLSSLLVLSGALQAGLHAPLCRRKFFDLFTFLKLTGKV